jgi:hypothetical protein
MDKARQARIQAAKKRQEEMSRQLNIMFQKYLKQKSKEQTDNTNKKSLNITDLPAEIICEIAKYTPASTLKLGMTCKTFHNILKKELDEASKIMINNNNIDKKHDELKEYLRNNCFYRDREELKRLIKLTEDIYDDA